MKKIFSILAAALFSASMFATTYTAAGSSPAVFGLAWDPTNTENDLVLVEGSETAYQLVKENIPLAAGDIFFKVCEDHGWKVAYPASDYQLVIPESGVYNITISFDADTKAVSATADKAGEAEVIPAIKLHGNFTGEWKDTEEFELAEDKLSASWKATIANGNYEFGVKVDDAWRANGAAFTRENPSHEVVSGSGNLTLAADVESGEYTFVWTFASNTLAVTYPEGEVIVTKYYITGDSAFVTDAGSEHGAWYEQALKATEDTTVFTLKGMQEYKLKVLPDGSWDEGHPILGWWSLSEKPEGVANDENDNIVFKLAEDGELKIVYFVENEVVTFKLIGNFYVKPLEHENGYYLIGQIDGVSDWENIIDERLLTINEAADTEEYSIAVTFGEGDQFQVVRVDNDAVGQWFPGNNNYMVSDEQVGKTATIYFRPNADGGEGWHYGVIYVATETTSVDNTAVEGKATKRIENGLLIIEKNGVKYNVLGMNL